MFAKRLGFLFAIFHFLQYNFASPPPSFPYYIFFAFVIKEIFHSMFCLFLFFVDTKALFSSYLISSLSDIFSFSPSQFPLRVPYLFSPFLLSCHPSIISAFYSLLFHFPSLCRLFPPSFSPLSLSYFLSLSFCRLSSSLTTSPLVSLFLPYPRSQFPSLLSLLSTFLLSFPSLQRRPFASQHLIFKRTQQPDIPRPSARSSFTRIHETISV